MVFDFFKGGGDAPLEEVEGLIIQMLLDDRHTFDLAINSVIGGTDPGVVGNEVRKSDRRVNKAERSVRRRLVVHAAVRGKDVDLPRLLISMSIIKDAERVGDYSKNIWDLANSGVDFSQAEDLEWLTGLRDRTSRYIAESARIYQERDVVAANELIPEMDAVLDEYDSCVEAQIVSEQSAKHAVPRALLCRYLKRITAHLMNVLTSIVMPVDRLDYYDEDRADRGTEEDE